MQVMSNPNPLSELISSDVYTLLAKHELLSEKGVRDFKIRAQFRSLREREVPAFEAIEELRVEYPYLQFDTIRKIVYHPGKFLNASLDKASEDNERNELSIEYVEGQRIGVVQIAGLVARRILCFAAEGQAIETGARFGLIRFGSRLDIYLPEGVQPLVCLGQTTVAGETVLADLVAPQEQRKCREI